MDIGSGNGYPSAALSNFAPHPFVIDGVECNSMEGFLQALKVSNIPMQVHMCSLVGRKAKFAGKNKKWWRDQTLYWQGVPIKRDSKEYQLLLDRAYGELFKNAKFRKALAATGNATLKHSMGRKKINETVLTINEFTSRLTTLRANLTFFGE